MKEKKKKYYQNSRPEMLKFIPVNSTKILEIGCGVGNFACQLMSNDKEVWGLEPDKESAEEASEKLNKIIIGSIEESLDKLPDNYFDVIIFNDVLEHLLEPWNDIKNIKDKLKKKGVLVASIPNVRYAKNLFKYLFFKDWKYTDDNILDVTHYRFFTRKSIKRMFLEQDYTIHKFKGINVTRSFLYFPLACFFNVLFLFTQLDIFYMQFAVVAKK